MGKQNTRRHRTRCARNRVAGGGLGSGYHLGTEMLARGYAVVEPYSSCGALSRPGMMSTDMTGPMGKGLPGLTGGARRSRRQRKGQRKGQRGGRYDMVMAGAEFEALGPRGGMMATAMRAPCEAGQGSPLPSPTQLTAPAFKGGAQLAPAPFLQEQTAGYTQMSSKWLDSVGAPVQLHEPVGGRMGTPACGQTGGRRMRGGDNHCDEATAALDAAQVALNAAQATGDNQTITTAQEVLDTAQAAMEQACQTTTAPVFGSPNTTETETEIEPTTEGGRRKQRKASRKQRKSNRKNRKASRKNRKASRKNRK